MRTEACVCGGTITAPNWQAAGPYIEGHNVSPQHYVWRLRNGISRERPTADRIVVTCPGTAPVRPPLP